jgi:Fe-S-cluster containining protein
MLPEELKLAAKLAEPSNKKLIAKLQRLKPKDLDDVAQALHEETFEHIDCLQCANCCKTTSPIFQEGDITRIAKHLKMKTSVFIATYLHIDADGDYVLNTAPCPFLDDENYCTVYANRPTACREYPHTNRKRFYQLLDLSLKNTEICPAVYHILEELKKVYEKKI